MERPEKLGKYRILRLLATGGMGEVFLARQEGPAGFAKTVVVKRILQHLAHDQSFTEMFLNEARLAALLTHPNIVQIFELAEDGGSWFIAMEYVHGRSLRAIKDRLLGRREVVAPALAARLCSQALQGLHYAHTLTDDAGQPLGIVHRDVSPENVLIGFAGAVKLLDFGIAKAGNTFSQTRTGTLKGKCAYMAPEQLRGNGRVDPRTDLYAMGVLLYEMVTGALPFLEESDVKTIEAIVERDPKEARARNPNLPPAMNDIIMRALSKDPAARFASAQDMADALEGFVLASGEGLTQGHTGEFMRELFGNEVSPADPSGPEGTAVLPPPSPGPVEMSTLIAAAPTLVATGAALPSLGPVAPEGVDSHRAGGRNADRLRAALLGGVAAIALVSALGMWLWPKPLPKPGATSPPAPPAARAAEWAAPPVEVASAPPQPDSERADPPRLAEPKKSARPKGPVAQRSARHKASPKPKPGKVTVWVNPYAEVFYRGRSLGFTPIPALEVPAGVAQFTLKNKQLGVTRKVSIEVPAGGEVVLRADLFERSRL